MAIIEQLNKRYATKKFDASRKLSDNDLDNLLEAIRLSASSFGLQAYKILVVENEAIRKQLRLAAWNQSQITDASQLLVFAVNTNFGENEVDRFVENIANTRDLDIASLSDYAGKMKQTFKRPQEEIQVWLTRQVYIALGFGLVSAAAMDIDTCPIEGFDSNKFDEILELKEKGLKSVVLLAIGYRSQDDKYQYLTKVRRCKEEMFITI
jgi:nitroreductase